MKSSGLIFAQIVFCCFAFSARSQSIYLKDSKTPKDALPVYGTGYYRIGGYEVKGNPYYKPEFILGDIFSTSETAKNIYLRYDFYFQKVEFVSSSNPSMILIKEPGDLDSFLLYKKEKKVIVEEISFIYGTHVGATDKFYFCPLQRGIKYSVYKKYFSELVVPIERTGRAESRVFETQTEFWYKNESTKEFKKITASIAAIKNEFGEVKDLSDVLRRINMFGRPDEAMAKIFASLNE